MTDDLPQLAPETVEAPGQYDLREDSYHADPCPEPSLSGSIVKVLAKRSPRHAWAAHPKLNPEFEPSTDDKFDLGKAFHKLILGKGAELHPIDAKDFRTDKAKAERDQARAAGLIPLLQSQLERAEAMAAAARAQIPLWEELQWAMATGIPERTYIWKEETPFGEIWCRCLVDWTPGKGHLVPEWKSTEGGAGPDEFGAKVFWNLDYHIQAAWNARALRRAGLPEVMELFFAVTECTFPHSLACMKPSPVAIAMANRDIERAIVSWAWCLKHNKWPGYRPQLAWIDPPVWKEKGFLEREERNELDTATTIQLLEMAAEGRGQLEDQTANPDDPFGLPAVEGPAK